MATCRNDGGMRPPVLVPVPARRAHAIPGASRRIPCQGCDDHLRSLTEVAAHR